MSRRRAIFYPVVWLLAAALLAWSVIQCPATKAAGTGQAEVEQGNVELQDPNGFWAPVSELQIGRNAHENLIHGTSYHVPEGSNLFDCMIRFHSQRAAWFMGWFGLQFKGAWPGIATIENGEVLVATALRYGQDYATAIPLLLFESGFGTASWNFYGFKCGNSGSFAKQTDDAFRLMHRLTGGMNNPYAVFSGWNCAKRVYINNCLSIFHGLDGR